MINHIEIKIDCIHNYDETIPKDIVFEHLLNLYQHYAQAKLYAVDIEIGFDDKLTATRNGYYITLGKKLGIKTIRASVKNDGERVMQLYGSCIVNPDLREEYDNEIKAPREQIYNIVYFQNKILLQDYTSILSIFNAFVNENNIEVNSTLFNLEQGFITLDLKTVASRFINDSNALFIFLIEVDAIYKISTINGKKLEKYFPPH